MNDGNGSFSGYGTADWTLPSHRIATAEGRLCGLLIATALAVCLQPTAPLVRYFRAVLFATSLLCRREIFALLQAGPLSSASVSAAAVLSIQYALAVARTRTSAEHQLPPKQPKPTHHPMVFPCHTTHARMFPTRHSFTYSYLLVGVPVGWQHDAGLLSCDPPPGQASKAWFSVHAEDYLARGGYQGGLRSKLNDFLQSHDVQPEVYPHAYLVTAPRFLGWSFNPVSFWYLYDGHMKLRAMILEVNNTFDERRMYLLEPSTVDNSDKFREKWRKDFHVSPFNDRLGDYSLLASDPFEPARAAGRPAQSPTIDNTITLLSPGPDARAKIVARVNSTSSSLDPANLSNFEAASFMFRWSWTGFFTNPRILREARMLWVKKLQLFYRPEVHVGSIGRQETSEEVILERAFRSWLRSLAKRMSVHINYISAAGPTRGPQVVLNGGNKDSMVFDVEVLTPEWYSEVARSQDLLEVIKRRSLQAADGEGMLRISEPGHAVFKLAIGKKSIPDVTPASPTAALVQRLAEGSSLLMALLGVLLEMARSRSTSLSTQPNSVDEMFRGDAAAESEVESARLRVLLADRIALGFTRWLGLYVSALWAVAVFWSAARCRSVVLDQTL